MKRLSFFQNIEPFLLKHLLVEFFDCDSLLSLSLTCKELNQVICGPGGVSDELLFRISPTLTNHRSSAKMNPAKRPIEFGSNLHTVSFYEDIRRAKRSFMVSCGESHTVITLDEKSIFTFGQGSHGRLGNGCEENSEKAQRITIDDADLISGKVKIKSVVGGSAHTLILLSNGKIYGFGDNRLGQLGPSLPYSSITAPMDIGFDQAKISMISCARDYSAIVLDDEEGTVIILGNGLAANTGRYLDTKFKCLLRGSIADSEKITQCSAGYGHLLLVNDAGKAYSVGDNKFGQLGIGSDIDKVSEPVVLAFNHHINPVAQVAAGEGHSMLLTRDGNLFTWGDGRKGQLGDGCFQRSVPEPREVKLPGNCFPVIITCGNTHSVILDLSGRVVTFGNNGFGQTGTANAFFSVNRPTIVSSGQFKDSKRMFRKLVHIAAGATHTAVLGKDKKLYMFGQTDKCGGGGFIRRATVKSAPLLVALDGGIATRPLNNKVFYTERYKRR